MVLVEFLVDTITLIKQQVCIMMNYVTPSLVLRYIGLITITRSLDHLMDMAYIL
nr:MAG TPA_asm: hypothetical protein [Bacteriophage sp.]